MRFTALITGLLAAVVVSAAVVADVDAADPPKRGGDRGGDRDRDRKRPSPSPPPPSQRPGGGNKEMPLLKLYGIPGVTSSSGKSSFTAVGVPGKCQNFPDNVTGFDRADPAYGYSCDIYTDSNCRGSSLNVETPLPEVQAFGDRSKPKKPMYQSWKCKSVDDTNFPPY